MAATGTSGPDDLSLPQQQYVEAIAQLIEGHGHAHPAEIARLLGVRKPSVTEGVGRLVALGVARRHGQEVLFTARGTAMAEELNRRHGALRSFMVSVLAMEPKAADEAACRIEHSASPGFVQRLLRLEAFFEEEPVPGLRQAWHTFVAGAEGTG